MTLLVADAVTRGCWPVFSDCQRNFRYVHSHSSTTVKSVCLQTCVVSVQKLGLRKPPSWYGRKVAARGRQRCQAGLPAVQGAVCWVLSNCSSEQEWVMQGEKRTETAKRRNSTTRNYFFRGLLDRTPVNKLTPVFVSFYLCFFNDMVSNSGHVATIWRWVNG